MNSEALFQGYLKVPGILEPVLKEPRLRYDYCNTFQKHMLPSTTNNVAFP